MPYHEGDAEHDNPEFDANAARDLLSYQDAFHVPKRYVSALVGKPAFPR
ncbi:hypothetical protein [Vreelandella andesensis]|nr:hypothetical protein [Halomonas andesensis]